MADQDFNIKVVTTADTSGIDKTAQKIGELDRSVLAASKRMGISYEEALKKFSSVPSLPTGAPDAPPGGGNLIGSLIGSFAGTLIGHGLFGILENVTRLISEWAENIRKAAEEQRALNREIAASVKGYESVHTAAQWEQENDKIEQQIQLLRDRLKVATNTTEIENINKEIAARERQQQDLAILAQRGYERARAEEKVNQAIHQQIEAMARAEKAVPIGAEEATRRREEAQRDYDATREIESQQMASRADAARLEQESADAEAKVVAAKKDLLEKRGYGSAPDIVAAQERLDAAEREAQIARELASGAAAYVRELDHGKAALDAQLQTTKAILEYRQRAEAAALAAEQSELFRRVPGLGPQPIHEASMSIQRVLMNEQAAAIARQQGHEKDAEMFQKSAEAYKGGLSSSQLAELEHLRDLMTRQTENPMIKAINDQTEYMKTIWGG